LLLASAAINLPAWAAHVKLGEPEVRSTIGSPLWVRIPVEPESMRDEIPAQRFSLAPGPAQSGIPFIERAEIGLEQVGERYFLSIRTRTGVGEPVIGLVIRERLPEGTRSREFTLFIDPPQVGDAARVTPDATPTRTIDAIVPPPAAPVVPAPQTAAEARAQQTADASSMRPARKSRTRSTAPISAAAAPATRANAPVAPVARSGKSAKPRANAAPRGSAATLSGPKLSLSMSTGELSVSPNASPEMREELKMRRMLLDLDDLTAALLERQNRIGQLEKELASLSARMAAAEQRIGAPAPQGAVTPATQAIAAPAAESAVVPPPSSEKPAAIRKPAAIEAATPAVTRTSMPWWGWASLLAALAAAFMGWRIVSRSRERGQRLTLAETEAFIREASETTSAPAPALQMENATATAKVEPPVAPMKRPARPIADVAPAAPPRATIPEPASPAPVAIEFELPPLAAVEMETQASPMAAAAPEPSNATTTRRARFIKARYHDIAILNPPLDSPQRLLWQASTLYGEGATDFAKRLLKYAAYSRQLTEEYWLALFELLYREKLTNDFVVNARWYRTHHPRSNQWEAVQRVGYLLDPAEPLFAEAASWSSEEPEHGVWLPASTAPAAPKFPVLKLELAG
jgi:hypothetical protein